MANSSKVKNAKSVLKKLYDGHTIAKIALTILAAVLLVYVIASIPVWSIGAETLASFRSRQPAIEMGSEISIDAGKVQVASNGGSTLTVNTADMTFEVENEAGTKFRSYAQGGGPAEMALVSLAYLGEDNNLYEWNSYANSVAFSSYSMQQIENGVRIDIDLNEGESNRFYEYMPKKMGIDTYEEVFVGGLNRLMEEGSLDEATGKRYLNTLSLVYKRSLTEECYSVTYNGTPPISATTQLIEVTKLVGYTTDMLLEDGEKFGFSVDFTEPAQFDLIVELTLDEDGNLIAHVPTGSIVSGNDYYTPQNLTLLPNFGAATADQYAEGKILLPDGSGALVNFNSYISKVTDYKRPVYDNDFFSDYYFMPEYAEELTMPIFGALYGPQDKTEKAFLGIIEEGARTALLNVKLASEKADSSNYNKVYPSFDIAQYKRVKINGEYSTDSGTYLTNVGMQDMDLTVSYHLYDRNTTYFDLAKGYQTYLAKAEGISPSYGAGEAELYLEVVGGINITSRFVGIPYSKAYSMTSYAELQEIMNTLDGMNIRLQYDGAFNGGWNGQMNRGAKLAGQNGSKSDLDATLSLAESKGVKLYLQTALSRVWEGGNGFRASRQAIRDYANEVVLLSRYQPVLGILNRALNDGRNHDAYYLLSPKYLSAVTDSFLKEAGDYPALAVTDLAGMYYADYRYEEYISGEMGNLVLEENLAKLASGRDLALANPHIDKIGYGSIATDISRESSDYATFDATIPFRQLVMNGLVDYTTKDVNLSSKDTEYFVLQSAELGAIPKFILTYKNVDVLKDSDYNYLFSAQFELLEDTIRAVYEECAQIRRQIGTDEIAGHEVLADGVCRTTYATGAQATVNYNLYDVTLDDGTVVPAEGYLIEEGN